ncbi:MAG: alpha-L-fucosidase [Phycisphaerae bacterium]
MNRSGSHDASFQWLEQNRFGLFIHWGLYSLPARHEWIQKLEAISPETYDQYFRHFDPDLYDPNLWAKSAADAGMQYFCITAKHHEGFCLWDSDFTDFNVTKTPCGKDVLTLMVKAFRDHGLRTGLYYSLIDWHHPDFVIDSAHPLSNHPQRNQMNEKRDQKKYIQYLHAQVRELLTRYAPVDILFFDFSYPKKFAWPPNMEDTWVGKSREDWDSLNLLKMIRQISPNTLINDRLDLNEMEGGWDYRTPEQFEPRKWLEFEGKRVPWITCYTFSGSWGYHREESTWKSVEQLVQTLINVTSKGGSLLLNVGPTGRGEFDQRALDRLKGIGEWLKRHGRSIYGCTAAPDDLTPPPQCVYTYNPQTNRLYVHVYAWPCLHLHLAGLGHRVEYAQLLNDASEIQIGLSDWFAGQTTGGDLNTLTLTLPIQKPNVAVPVIELILK